MRDNDRRAMQTKAVEDIGAIFEAAMADAEEERKWHQSILCTGKGEVPDSPPYTMHCFFIGDKWYQVAHLHDNGADECFAINSDGTRPYMGTLQQMLEGMRRFKDTGKLPMAFPTRKLEDGSTAWTCPPGVWFGTTRIK